jgi:hypothetical protein
MDSIVYGSDGLGGKGCTRMRPEVQVARVALAPWRWT